MAACRKILFLDATETDNAALVGEIAHMVAERVDGPRGNAPLTADQRNLYPNLILLCCNHHTEIDQQPDAWPVSRLIIIKEAHENWVKHSLPGFDLRKQKDDELYAEYLDYWSNAVRIDEWTEWSSAIFAFGQPRLHIKILEDISSIPRWTMKRVWPGRYRDLEFAFGNFSNVLNDFINKFNEHADKPYADADQLMTMKFYQIEEWNPEKYRRLSQQYEFHVDLLQDLGLELTRAANLVCDRVRDNIISNYRLKEGRLSISSGPHEDLSWRESVVEYSSSEKKLNHPYPGINRFLIDRSERDMHYGSGAAATC